MAKKKKITTVEEELPEDLPEFPDVGELDPSMVPPDAQELIDQLSETATKWTLGRKNVRTNRLDWLGSYDVGELSLDTIKQDWGGGRYVLRMFAPDETGRVAIRKVLTFSIDESIKPVPRESPVALGGRDPLVEKLIERSLDGSNRDPMAIAAEFAKASATQMQAVIAMMVPLFEKLAGGNRSGGSVTEMLQIMEFGLDHLGSHDDGYMGVVKEVGLPLVKLLGEQVSKTKLPGVAPAPALPPASTAPPWVGTVRMHLQAILPYIQQGVDPLTIVSAMEVRIPKFVAWLDRAVADPNFRAQLLANVPEVGPHMGWIDRFLAEFGPEDEEDEMPNPPKGNEVTGEGDIGDEGVQ